MTAREPANIFEADELAHLRVPPHSMPAESSVLGGLLLSNDAWDRVGDILNDSDFYRAEHRLIFAAISSLANANKPADVVTVWERLRETGKADECGGLAYLHSLAQYVPSAGNIRRYAETVRERSVLRRLIAAADSISAAAFASDGKSLQTVLDEAEQAVCQIGESQAKTADDWQELDQAVADVLDHIQEQADGSAKPDFIPSGLHELDERLDGGMRPGDLIVLGARPSMGKTALALNIAQHVAGDVGLPVAVFTMEMSRRQLTNRFLARLGRIHLSRIRRPERLRDADWPALATAVEHARQSPIHINDQSGLNIIQVRSKARALARKVGKLGLIVIDYLGLMPGVDAKMPRAYQIEQITQGLKALAKELRCPLLLLVQLNRKVEERADQMPILSDLRDSGSVEQDADIVMFVHRPFKANPLLGIEWREYAKLAIAKLREGEPGILDLRYVGEHVHFTDWPADWDVPSSKVQTKRSAPL